MSTCTLPKELQTVGLSSAHSFDNVSPLASMSILFHSIRMSRCATPKSEDDSGGLLLDLMFYSVACLVDQVVSPTILPLYLKIEPMIIFRMRLDQHNFNSHLRMSCGMKQQT